MKNLIIITLSVLITYSISRGYADGGPENEENMAGKYTVQWKAGRNIFYDYQTKECQLSVSYNNASKMLAIQQYRSCMLPVEEQYNVISRCFGQLLAEESVIIEKLVINWVDEQAFDGFTQSKRGKAQCVVFGALSNPGSPPDKFIHYFDTHKGFEALTRVFKNHQLTLDLFCLEEFQAKQKNDLCFKALQSPPPSQNLAGGVMAPCSRKMVFHVKPRGVKFRRRRPNYWLGF